MGGLDLGARQAGASARSRVHLIASVCEQCALENLIIKFTGPLLFTVRCAVGPSPMVGHRRAPARQRLVDVAPGLEAHRAGPVPHS
jgi:hypothetical protein